MTTNKPEAAHLADAHAEFEAWASTHFFLQEEDTTVDDSYEYISCDMQLAWEAYQAGRAECEKLRKDAERYRWLRDPCSGAERVVMYGRGDYGRGLMKYTMLDGAIDAAIDAAIEM